MTTDEMKARTKSFALRIIKLVETLPPTIAFKKMFFRAGGASDISRWRNHRKIGDKTLPALEGRRTEASVLRPSRARIPIASGTGGFSTG